MNSRLQRDLRFSIIVPTFNRPAQLGECLDSLTRLEYSRELFEVVVVDDGSCEPLDDTVGKFTNNLNVTLLRTKNQGPAAARNIGIEIARGQYFAFTDDDCQPHPDWLSKLEERLSANAGCMVGGRTVNRLIDNAYSTTSQLIVDLAYDFYNSRPNDALFFASNNMAVCAETFRKLGGFNSGFRIASEDRELCDRWRHEGHHIAFAPQAVIGHAHSLGLLNFCRQHFRYGRGAAQYHRVRSARGSGRLRDDMRFHACLPRMLRSRMSKLKLRQMLTVTSLLALWQIVNALGFFYQKLYARFGLPQRKSDHSPRDVPFGKGATL